jgi:hypothetical protein
VATRAVNLRADFLMRRGREWLSGERYSALLKIRHQPPAKWFS